MKLIVMSDNHGDKETVKAVSSLPADAHFHCGDSEFPYDAETLASMIRVGGNCDIDSKYPGEVVTTIKEKKILAVHGHKHNVKSSLMDLYYRAKEKDVDIVLFGHSHLYGAEMKDGILFVNPGSTMLPRGGNPATYAVIEWDETPVVTFKNMDHQVVESVEIKNI
jgi:uncharacterized protein